MTAYSAHNSFSLMEPSWGARMLAALSDNRDRFNRAEEIKKYAGVAPATLVNFTVQE